MHRHKLISSYFLIIFQPLKLPFLRLTAINRKKVIYNKMLNLIKPRHLALLKKHFRKEHTTKDKEFSEEERKVSSKKSHSYFKKIHYNATRTKVTQFLEYRSEKIKILHHPSFWMLSKTYMKRLGICSPVQ